jgi:hypothetical protein
MGASLLGCRSCSGHSCWELAIDQAVHLTRHCSQAQTATRGHPLLIGAELVSRRFCYDLSSDWMITLSPTQMTASHSRGLVVEDLESSRRNTRWQWIDDEHIADLHCGEAFGELRINRPHATVIEQLLPAGFAD